MQKGRRGNEGILLLSIVLLLWSYACTSEEKFIGVYESEPSSRHGYTEIYLELNKGGEGIRRVEGKSLAFKWDLKGDEMRIYTKSGGIIVGRREGKDTLVVTLPGPRTVYFRRIK